MQSCDARKAKVPITFLNEFINLGELIFNEPLYDRVDLLYSSGAKKELRKVVSRSEE